MFLRPRKRKQAISRQRQPGYSRFQMVTMTLAVLAIAGWLSWRVFAQLAAREPLPGPGPAIEARLLAMWPEMPTWPEDQQAFLVHLATVCRLHRQPEDQDANATCLHRAVTQTYSANPESLQAATAVLDQMLAITQENLDDHDHRQQRQADHESP